MYKSNILRSRTGVLHLGQNSASYCNGRSGKFGTIALQQAEHAADSSFCKKCFGESPKERIQYMIAHGSL